MEWPQELLDIFEEREFADVHPTQPKATIDDRIKEAFRQINVWYRIHHREPQVAAERPERSYAMQLRGFRASEWKRELLRHWDEFNLLDEEL